MSRTHSRTLSETHNNNKDASRSRQTIAKRFDTTEPEIGEKRRPDISIQQALEAPRLVISDVSPCVDDGRYPAKAVVHQPVTLSATIFADGHNRLAARVLWKKAAATTWFSEPMTLLGNDLWQTEILPVKTARHYFRIEAWLDRWQNFHHELYEKFYAGVPVQLESTEGYLLLKDIYQYALAQNGDSRVERDDSNIGKSDIERSDIRNVDIDNKNIKIITHHQMSRDNAMEFVGDALENLNGSRANNDIDQQIHILLDQRLAEAVEVIEPRHFLTATRQAYVIDVERTRAGFSAWYELFPRSITRSDEQEHGTFDDVISRLPAIQAMGFDVLYFPPIHPIGERNRKGRNNNVTAAPGDPGSPYAIGSEEGGHDAVYSKLGGIESFRRLKTAAAHYGLEIALDFAIQCAPDHPWLTEHPDWFSWRPDGSIRYAENPPKKYQDIVNVDFYAEQALPDMWLAWRDIVLYWISEGVSIFRVDNPHTKPLAFWEWLIADIRSKHPEAIFLSEAFTRPAMMYQLAKIGFSQSYTYFIWRTSKQELTDYMNELAHTDVRDYFRPNFFVNTPDINPYFLQSSGRPGFLIRAALAATLSGLWGVYSGFELCEGAALPGKEEYLNSEKYEIRSREFSAPGNIVAEITRLNHIRKDNAALHTHLGVRFHPCSNDNVLYFSKAIHDNGNFILVAISLDPFNGQNAHLQLPVEEFGLGDGAAFNVSELMRNINFRWYGRHQHWYFDPQEIPFAIWSLKPMEV